MATTTNTTPLLVDGKVAAQKLGVTEDMIRKLMREGRLDSVKVGRCRRYRVTDLERIAMEGVA